jgi:hypothetical protein
MAQKFERLGTFAVRRQRSPRPAATSCACSACGLRHANGVRGRLLPTRYLRDLSGRSASPTPLAPYFDPLVRPRFAYGEPTELSLNGLQHASGVRGRLLPTRYLRDLSGRSPHLRKARRAFRLTVCNMPAGFGVVFYRLVTFATLAVARLRLRRAHRALRLTAQQLSSSQLSDSGT